MPAIVIATVVRWQVEGDPPAISYPMKPRLRLDTSDPKGREVQPPPVPPRRRR